MRVSQNLAVPGNKGFVVIKAAERLYKFLILQFICSVTSTSMYIKAKLKNMLDKQKLQIVEWLTYDIAEQIKDVFKALNDWKSGSLISIYLRFRLKCIEMLEKKF